MLGNEYVELRKPIVFFYRTLYGAYLYSANLDAISQISDNTYYELERAFRGCVDDKIKLEKNPEIDVLIRRGFFSERRVEELYHPQVEIMRDFSERALPSITLQVTQNCNLRCRYCIYSEKINQGQRSHSPRRMKLETSLKAIDFLYEHSIDSETVNIGFYGGEPLLEFDLIKKVVSYADERFRGRKHTFSITTNATLLDLEKYTYMDSHDFSITISMDGDRETHNRNRIFSHSQIGSFDAIIQNIQKIEERFPDVAKKISISAVVDANSPLRWSQDLDNEYERYLENTNAGIAETDDPNEDTFSPEFSEMYQYICFIDLRRYYKNIKSKHKIPPICRQQFNYMQRDFSMLGGNGALPKIGAPSGPCMPGLFRLFVDVDGNFLPCERVSEQSSIMRIGSLEKGFLFDKMAELLNFSKDHEKCKICPAFRHCGICAKFCDDGDALSKSAYEKACHNAYENFKLKLKYWSLFYSGPMVYT